jgi:hypothetical protein
MNTVDAAMSNEEVAWFARSVVSWLAGRLHLAVLEAQTAVGAAAPTTSVLADLRESLHAVVAIEQALTGQGRDTTDGEILADRFCTQLVWGMCALFEWRWLEIMGERGSA